MKKTVLLIMIAFVFNACADSENAFSDSEDIEIMGTWVYSGSLLPGFQDTLIVTNESLTENGDDNGSSFSGVYTMLEYDNDEDRYKIEYVSGSGTPYSAGDVLYVKYDVSGDTIEMSYSETDYPDSVGDTEAIGTASGNRLTFTKSNS